MPSAPKPPTIRQSAMRAAPKREVESFEQVEGFEFTLAAGAGFQQVVQFAGRPDSIYMRGAATQVRIRLREPGEAPNNAFVLGSAADLEIKAGARIIEAQSPGGGGGEFISGLGRYISRDIDVREDRQGPARSDSFMPEKDWSTQIEVPGGPY